MGLTFSRKIAVLYCAAVVLCALGSPAYSEESKLEVIGLKHLTSEQAVNLLKPLLDKEGAISGMNNQLVVRTTPGNLEQIKQALAALDVAPHRLMITVKQDVNRSRESSAAEVSGHIRSGKVVTTVGRDDPREQAGAEVRITRTDTLRDDRNTQQLQVLEGTPAFIEIGESVPVAEPGFILAPQPIVYNSISYKDLTTGFSVLPRIHGDEVTVEIAPHRAVLSREGGGKIDIQASHTTVSGKLGEWLDLGGAVQRQSSAEGGIVYSTRGLSSEQSRVLIKVEKLDQ
ncbi:MAG TPA: secretin N-terminal domain-containing protein [Gammaproteobacteria bacterium]|nr:secretin N-terminal domain-containing protein [Gammaproteobacteria bacterium]